MSEQHEDHVEPEVVPVEVSEDHEVVEAESVHSPVEDSEGHEPADTPDRVEQPEDHDGVEGDPDEHVEAGQDATTSASGEGASDESQPQTFQEERYERATVDPEYAEQQAIEVPEEDRGPAWEHGSLAAQAALEGADDLEVNDSPPEWDDADRSEEV
jgi:hypothetical protein